MGKGNEVSGLAFEEKSRGLFVHFTDGTIATVDDLTEKLKGRGLDSIAKIELYPTGGGRLDGVRGTQQVRGQAFTIEELPFTVNVILPLETAQAVGRGMAEPSIEQALWTPPE